MKKLLFTFSALILSVTSFAQTANSSGGADQRQDLTITVGQHALLKCATPTHDFAIAAPTVAGAPITIGSPTLVSYLQTSMMTATGFPANGSLNLDMTGLPAGFILKVLLEEPSVAYGAAGTRVGDFGNAIAGGQQIYNSSTYLLLDLMGSHYTQTGATDGWKSTLTLSIDLASYAALSENSTPVVLQYTLAN